MRKSAILLCLLCGCERAAAPVAKAPAPPPPVPVKPALDIAAEVAKVRTAAHGHGAEAYHVMDLIYARIEDHFSKRLAKTDKVAGDLFSAKWKWRATFWSDADYNAAVRRLMEKELFDGMPALLDAVARDVAAAAEASDNKMMAEVAGLVRTAAPSVDVGRLSADYRVELGALVVRDAEMNLVSFAASDFVAALVTGALAASGVFGPAVAAGMATSWWNLGISLVVAVVAAVAVDAIVGDSFEAEARTTIYAQVSRYRMDAMRRIGDAALGTLRRYVESREEAAAKAAEKALEASIAP